jgi:hypothetical protein
MCRAFLAGSPAGVLLAVQPTEICHLENPLRSRRVTAGHATPGCDSIVRADRATNSHAARDNFCCAPVTLLFVLVIE